VIVAVVVAVGLIMMIIPMTIAVIFVVPVAFMKLPSLLIVVVVRMTPICALVRRLFPSASNPSVMVALWGPIALNPDVAGTGCIASLFVTNWRRSASYVYRNLR